MARNYTMSDNDKRITNRAIELTSRETLEKLFGERDSYEIPNHLNINAISNKAFYKLSNDEIYYLKVRSTIAFAPLKDYYTRRAKHLLGFDFNQDFGIQNKSSFNLQSLSLFEEGNIDQTVHIPLKQEIVDKIMSAPKFKVEVQSNPNSNFAQQHRTAEYYLCEIDNQIVPVVLVEKNQPLLNYDPPKSSRSLSVFVLLQGKIPFFVSRLDFNPFNKHTNRLKNGNVTTKKITSKETHQHLYSERFAILVPTTKRIMHCDTINHGYLKTFDDVEKFVKRQINAKNEHNPQLESGFKNEKLKQETKNKKQSYKKAFEDLDFNM